MRFRIAVGVSLVVSLAFATTDRKQVVNVPLNVRVGLWRMTYTTEHSGPTTAPLIAPELLAKMSPEQRARTEARLKARAIQGAQVETRQYCVTEERLKKAAFDVPETAAACPRTLLISTPKVQQFRDECAERFGPGLDEARLDD